MNFISVMPTNLYGPNANFDPETSDVLHALMRKIHEATVSKGSTVTVWGSGTPHREFLYVDELVDACVFLMERYNAEQIGEFVNIGTGEEISIRGLAELLSEVIGYEGKPVFDTLKPDGTPRKVMDITRLKRLGWKPEKQLKEGITHTYGWYVENVVRR